MQQWKCKTCFLGYLVSWHSDTHPTHRSIGLCAIKMRPKMTFTLPAFLLKTIPTNIFLTGLFWLYPKHWNPLWRSAGHRRQKVCSAFWNLGALATVCSRIRREANGLLGFLTEYHSASIELSSLRCFYSAGSMFITRDAMEK